MTRVMRSRILHVLLAKSLAGIHVSDHFLNDADSNRPHRGS